MPHFPRFASRLTEQLDIQSISLHNHDGGFASTSSNCNEHVESASADRLMKTQGNLIVGRVTTSLMSAGWEWGAGGWALKGEGRGRAK